MASVESNQEGLNDQVNICGGLLLNSRGNLTLDLGTEGEGGSVERWIMLGTVLGRQKVNRKGVESAMHGA